MKRPGSSAKTMVWFGSVILAGLTASLALWNPLDVYERERGYGATNAPTEKGAGSVSAASSGSALPQLVAVLAGLLGSVSMLAVYFGRLAQESALMLERAQGDLQQARDDIERRAIEQVADLNETNRLLQAEVVDRRRGEEAYRDLAGQVLRLQDEERRRIARDLRDSTTQMLGALAINIGRARALCESSDLRRLDRVLLESGQFLEEVTQEIRTVSYLLHPPMLDDLGLEYVLPWYAHGFSRRSGIATTLNIQPDLGRLPREVEVTLFRVVQEALANVNRQRGGASVVIGISRSIDAAILEVRDHGAALLAQSGEGGVEPKAVSPTGVGIAGMRERVRQLGGRIDICSDGDGTMLRTVLPLAA